MLFYYYFCFYTFLRLYVFLFPESNISVSITLGKHYLTFMMIAMEKKI